MGFFNSPDTTKPGVAQSFDLAASLAAARPSFVGDALMPLVNKTTKSILAALELGKKFTGITEEAWVKIMMEQEKGIGSASPRGCYPVRTRLDLNKKGAAWHPEGSNKDPLYLVKKMLNQILDEAQASAEWELRYPTVKNKQWEENTEKRSPVVRLVIGRPPPLFFVDLNHNDFTKAGLNDSTLLRDICEGRIPPQLDKDKQKVSDWFKKTPNATPYLAIWLSDSDQSTFKLHDPRMNVMTLQVYNSDKNDHPMLPFQLNGMFAHALTDGEPAKQRMEKIWEAALAKPSQEHEYFPDQGDIKQLPVEAPLTEPVKVENPFRETGFRYKGCRKMADALEVDEVSTSIKLYDQELQAILSAAKKLGCKTNSLFMLGLLGITGESPVTSVATTEKFFKDKDNKKRRKRIQVTSFGNKPFYNSPQFRALSEWVKNPQLNVSFDKLLNHELFTKFPKQLTEDLFKHVALYESQVSLAQQHDLGFLTYSAALADQRRKFLEKIVGAVSPHMIALVRPQMQFSTLGAKPEIGGEDLEWQFESAGSGSVVNTFGLVGSELSFREHLDNPIALFDVWQMYVKQFPVLLVDLLGSTFNNGLLSDRLVEWLQRVVSGRSKDENVIAHVPIEIGGTVFSSIHVAIAEAGRDSAIMEDVMGFLDELIGATADFMGSSLSKTHLKKAFLTFLDAQAFQTLNQAVTMTEALTHVLLLQNNLAESIEAAVTGGASNMHKQDSVTIAASIAPAQGSAHM